MAWLRKYKDMKKDRVGGWPVEDLEDSPREVPHATLLVVSKCFWYFGQGPRLRWLLSALPNQKSQPSVLHLNSKALARCTWAGLGPLLPSLLRLPLSFVLWCISSTGKTMIQVHV